jgi:Ala-tRNA(Pro) deacylase
MQPTTTHEGRPADKRLLRWLATASIDHEVHHHATALSSDATARAEGVDPHQFVKAVIVETADGRDAILALEASDRVDLAKACEALSTSHVHLLTEDRMAAIAPDCDPGAWPPVGAWFAMPVVADRAIHDEDAITFNAGSHDYAVRVDRAGWERAAAVRYADLAEDHPGEPAWMR